MSTNDTNITTTMTATTITSLRPEEPTGLNHLDLALIQALGLGN